MTKPSNSSPIVEEPAPDVVTRFGILFDDIIHGRHVFDSDIRWMEQIAQKYRAFFLRENTNCAGEVAQPRFVVPLPCPFCGAEPSKWVADPGAPYPGGFFEICCENNDCAVGPCLSEKRRTDLEGMTHAEAEASIWPELIAKWNRRHNIPVRPPEGSGATPGSAG